MIVNTLAKTLSTPKEQDIEMPPIHENSRKRGWEDAKPDLPSMKKPEIMDDKLKMMLSSMKRAENVDGKFKMNCAPKVGHNKFKHERIKVSN